MGERPPVAPSCGGGGGGGREGNMQCREHPYRANLGGICAFCLQEKLQKLVSSSDSFPATHHSSSSPTSSSPSFRSTYVSSSSSVTAGPASVTSNSRSRMSFLYSSYTRAYRNKKKDSASASVGGRGVKRVNTSRSSNTVAPTSFHPMDSPRRRWFWSFLSQHSNTTNSNNPNENSHRGKVEDMTTPATTTTFGRKVARSRSVGCGSRSFSGDFLERISTGLGDCGALRRVESQREGKVALHRASTSAAESSNGNDEGTVQQQRVRCSGIFGGFGTSTPTPTLSSTTSISNTSRAAASYWAPEQHNGRGKGWGWTFASPMRVFRPSSTTTKTYVLNTRDDGGGAPTTPGNRRLVTGRVSNMVAAKG